MLSRIVSRSSNWSVRFFTSKNKPPVNFKTQTNSLLELGHCPEAIPLAYNLFDLPDDPSVTMHPDEVKKFNKAMVDLQTEFEKANGTTFRR